MQVDIEKIIPVTEARDSFNKIVDEVEGSDELYVLTKNGKPAAVIVGVNHLEKLTGETEGEVMAKVESKPEAPDAAPATGGTTLRPFQINNYDGEPAPAAPPDTSMTPPAPAPISAPDTTPAMPDTTTPAAFTPQSPADTARDVGPYDPFKIPEDTPADAPADTTTPPADPSGTPPQSPTDQSV